VYANITALTILNDTDRIFSVLTDWTDESGANWPEDDTIAERLGEQLGRKIQTVEYTGGGDDLNEGIYTWSEAATCTISRREDGITYVDCEALGWGFAFDRDGVMVRGIELARRLEDDGYDLAAWALSADVGASEDFPLA